MEVGPTRLTSKAFFKISMTTLAIFIGLIQNLNSQCSGTYYDTGGISGSYSSNANQTITYTADPGKEVVITFTAFDLENGFDFMDIYDGPNTSSTLIANNLTGSAIPPTYTSTTGKLTIHFTSDGNVNNAGWALNLSCVTACSNTTSGGVIASDQLSCGSFDPLNMTSSSVATGGSGTISYGWQLSTNGSSWSDIPSTDMIAYDPSTINTTTYYRRMSKTGTCTSWSAFPSNTIKKGVSTPITISNVTVSSCINHPLQDVATVNANISWTNPIPANTIVVELDGKKKYISASALTSPQSIDFIVPANGLNKTISAYWEGLTAASSCSSNSNFNAPVACSNDQISCNILYLCGLDKPWDGYPFDHGIIDYLDLVSSGTVTPVLTKNDAVGLGTYDVNNQTVAFPVNLNDYKLIIVSATTEGYLSIDMKKALESYKGSIFLMNYEASDELGYTNNASSYLAGQNFATSPVLLEKITDYGNVNPTSSYLMTGGDYKSNATAALWFNASSATNNIGGIYYKYNPHTISGVSSTHGQRVYFGLHMNGIYANSQNGGALPVPASFDFVPTKHLTLKGKQLFDQALVSAAACNSEICGNGTDDDGDDLADCFDPDCNEVLNGEFDSGTASWSLYQQAGNTSALSIDNAKVLSGRNSAKVVNTVVTGTDWHVQLAQAGKSIQSGKTYKISFMAKASVNMNASVSLQLSTSPFTTYAFSSVSLTTTNQNFSFEFTASTTVNNNTTLLFNLGTAVATIWIDRVEFKEACTAASALNCGLDCISANLINNPDFETNLTGWSTTNGGIITQGGGGVYGNFMVLNNADVAGTFTVYQDVTFGSNKPYYFSGYAARHAMPNNPIVYLEFYNGTTFISKTSDFVVTHNYDGNFQQITPFTGTTPAGTTKIRIVGSGNTVALKVDKFSLQTCDPRPTITSSTPGNRCGPGSVNLSAAASGGTINWFSTSSGGTSLFSGSNFATPSISITTTYYAETTLNGCTSSRTPVQATINNCSAEICNNGIDDDGDGVIDNADPDCLPVCTPPTFSFINPILVSGTSLSVGAIYKFSNVLPNVDARLTILSKSHTDIEILSIDEPQTSYGGYADAIQPIIDYNFYNGPGSYDAPGDKSVNFRINFVKAGTTNDTIISNIGATGIDIDGSGEANEMREFIIGTNSNSYATLPGSLLNISGSIKALGPITNFTDIDESAQEVMITYNFAGQNQIDFSYGANYGGSTDMVDDALPNSDEKRLNSLYLKCYGLTNVNCVTVVSPPTAGSPASRCGAGSVTLNVTGCANGKVLWYDVASGSNPIAVGNSFPTPSLSATKTYYAECEIAGCKSATRTPMTATINAIPNVSITGSNTICVGSTTTLSPNAGGTWASSNNAIATVTNAGVVTGVSQGTATFTFTNSTTNCISNATLPVTINPRPTVSITGPNPICVGATTTLSPSTGGTWSSSNNGIATVNASGLVTGISAGTATFTFTNSTTGCVSNSTAPVTVAAKPVVSITGFSNICIGTTTTLSPTSGGNWTSSNNSIATVNSSGVVTGVSAGTVTFTFTNSTTGCTSDATSPITINSKPTVGINYNGSQCLTTNSSLTANASGGSPAYTYNWTGPSSFTSTSQTITITQNGNYYITVTDSKGCNNTSSGFVYTQYVPNITSLSTTVCEGTSINLSANGSNAVSYLWGANAGNATTASVTVTPSFPSSTYVVTVTNNIGCSASASTTINVNQKPTVSINGPNPICVGSATTLSPPTGGIWTSSNSAVATVSSNGQVIGVSAGSATFTFTNTTTNCISNPTLPVTVNPKPVVTITGPTGICIGSTTSVSPTSGGTWLSSNTGVASIQNNGVITGISAGSATFTFTNSTTQCTSDNSAPITVDALQSLSITGQNNLCLGQTTTLNPSTGGGTWSSSNNSIATIDNSGLVTAISAGNVIITYTKSGSSCANTATFAMVINATPPISVSGPNIICQGSTTNLTPSSGGTWNSSNNSIATITNTGLVTGVSAGSVTFTFTNSATGCTSNPSATITILGKPTVSITGPTSICVNSTTQLSPNTGGIWTTSSASVASVSNTGVVTGNGAGTVTFTFTSSTTGCTSNATAPITVNPRPTLSVNFHGSQCLTASSQLSVNAAGGTSPYTYSWTGPNGFTSIQNLNNITNNGNYYVTVSDANLCSSTTVAFIYQQYQPVIVSLGTNICEGQSLDLTVSASNATTYQWDSNAGNATSQTVTVYPTITQNTYNVTVTNNAGCQAVATANISVNPKPVVNITGPASICIGGSTSLTPVSGGIWTSSNPTVASITNGGIVYGLTPGTATFTFTSSATGCVSNASAPITIGSKPTIVLTGPSSICIGGNTTFTPGVGGTWTSSNPAVATITNSGIVTGISAGTANFTFSVNGSCVSDPSVSISVNNKPTVNITGPTQLCIGGATNLSPNNGGVWTSSNPGVASVNNTGHVAAISAGTATFTFYVPSTGCTSNPTTPITVNPRPLTSITGDSILCIGETTQLSSIVAGTWSSNNTNVATIDNNGLVVAYGPGQTTFIFTSTLGCTSNPSRPVIVNPTPFVQFNGPTAICIGSTTNILPGGNTGTWISNNPSIASITNSGLITAISAGQATFKYTDNSTGCFTNTTIPLVVYTQPPVNITGPNSICIGGNTTLSPSNGGIWTSLNPSVAVISNQGVVTGLSAGSATFTFTESGSGCVSQASAPITVSNNPTVTINGPSSICIGSTSIISPTSGGTWSSSNSSIAMINNSGVITGISQGIATFTYTANGGCASNSSAPITVNGKTGVAISGPTAICIGGTTQLFPQTGGVWISSKPNIATVTNSGVVTGIATGTAKFVYTDNSTGCKSDSTSAITVNEPPFINLIGPGTICAGTSTNVAPTVGGIWTSSNNNVASVTNNGQVNGINAGSAALTFVNSSTGCPAAAPINITVVPKPVISLPNSTLCEGATLQMVAPEAGTWIARNPGVATINSSGLITGISQGMARFAFTASSSGCTSEDTAPAMVNGRPLVSLQGPSNICIGGTTQAISSLSSGTWLSSNSSIASISIGGQITALSAGTTNISFISSSTGCVSDGNLQITVGNSISVGISGPEQICLGYTTQLFPQTGGAWTSNNPLIAGVNNSGVITGKAPGKVSFTFTESLTGCSVSLQPDAISIQNCTDPDFNVGLTNAIVNGDVSTNDEINSSNSYYGIGYTVISKPNGSSPAITINSDGTYIFQSATPGKYLYRVPVCIDGNTFGCPSVELQITVVDQFNLNTTVITNTDITTTKFNANASSNEFKLLKTLVNDGSINGSMNVAGMNITKVGNHGYSTDYASGDIEYKTFPGYVGLDTIEYTVCAMSNPGNCTVSKQIVITNATNASNSTVAADDFKHGIKTVPLTLNVLTNDSDPEGNSISVTPQGTAANPIVIAQGSYYLASNGNLSFTPESNFSGTVDIVYSICDNNAAGQACANATAHILILDEARLKLKVYLEGALMENNNALSSTGKPLMRDNLRRSPFNGQNYIPGVDPYKFAVSNFDVTPSFQHVSTNQRAEFSSIQDSTAVLAVSGENAIVDWVFVEIRSKSNNTQKIATRSGLVQRDGDIVDVDGISPLAFPGLTADSFYVVVRHRNHLGVMSMKVPYGQEVDFTNPSTPVFNFGTSKFPTINYAGLSQNPYIIDGYRALWAGDANSDKKIKFTNPNDDLNFIFYDVFAYPSNINSNANYNFAFGYFQGDYNMDAKTKFENPDDDKNLLYAQILFYPLNNLFLSNFNFFIEQVP